MRRTLIALLLALSLACDNPLPTTPTPPPSPPPVDVRPPRVDQDFSWSTYQGYIAFGLGHPRQEEEDVIATAMTMLGFGWNTANVCAEADKWDEGGTEYPRKPRDPERLRWTLDILARIPGVQVVLIGNCTLKRQVSLAEQEAWAHEVAKVAIQFNNIAISTHNEFDNCRGRVDWGGNDANCPGKNDIAKHIQIYRSYGIRNVNADDSIRPRQPGDSEQLTFGYRLANIGAAPASFHPDRTKDGKPWDPDVKYLQKVAKHNGEFVLSETVAWMDYSGRCDGLRTCDSNRIEAYIDACASVPECRFTLHSENLLAGIPPTYIPRAQ